MPRLLIISSLSVVSLVTTTQADLNPLAIFNGHVGLSLDAVGGNTDPAGQIQAHIPDGATILGAYLYSAGTPFPFYPNLGVPGSPQSVADYNGSGITLGGVPITSFNGTVGAVSDSSTIGRWFTGRADVTGVINSLRTPGVSDYNWNVTEGALNERIDGEVLAVVYQDASLPQGSVVLLDGGQRTGGETKSISFTAPLGDVNQPGFVADMSLGISFSYGDTQHSLVDVNGARLTTSAGGYDDGLPQDGGFITAGGIGDLNDNPASPFSTDSSLDDELYSLRSFLKSGDAGLTLFTQNNSQDDNIFLVALQISGDVGGVTDVPTATPETGSTFSLLGAGLTTLAFLRRRKEAGKDV